MAQYRTTPAGPPPTSVTVDPYDAPAACDLVGSAQNGERRAGACRAGLSAPRSSSAACSHGVDDARRSRELPAGTQQLDPCGEVPIRGADPPRMALDASALAAGAHGVEHHADAPTDAGQREKRRSNAEDDR